MNIKAKKSLGQNFLIDREVLEPIVSTVDIANKEILEIGPGSGNLTNYILKKNPTKIFVIEKDDELALLLNEKFDNQIEIKYGAKIAKKAVKMLPQLKKAELERVKAARAAYGKDK